MTDASTRAADLLKEHRESIDRLDAILVYTLGRAFQAHAGRRPAEGRTRPAPRRTRRARHVRSNGWKIWPPAPIWIRNSPRNS